VRNSDFSEDLNKFTADRRAAWVFRGSLAAIVGLALIEKVFYSLRDSELWIGQAAGG
jgi:hypothetical protein